MQHKMTSLIKLGQYVKHVFTKKGITQKELSLMVFNKANIKYIGKLERSTLVGITPNTAYEIMFAYDSDIEFKEFKN
jgi:3-oxoacyl-[acyl-carrier-protein] synthase III